MMDAGLKLNQNIAAHNQARLRSIRHLHAMASNYMDGVDDPERIREYLDACRIFGLPDERMEKGEETREAAGA